MIARNTDGKLVSRPMSPHLQIYRWPLSMALSILHRASGIALSIGTLLLTWWLVAAATSAAAFATVQGFIGSALGMLMLFGWSVALIFHLCTGIRHLAWDMGLGFEPAEYEKSGRAVVIATAVGVVLVWAIGLTVWRG